MTQISATVNNRQKVATVSLSDLKKKKKWHFMACRLLYKLVHLFVYYSHPRNFKFILKMSKRKYVIDENLSIEYGT